MEEFVKTKKELYDKFYLNDDHRWNKNDSKILYKKYNKILLETLLINKTENMKSFLEIGPGDGRFIELISNNKYLDNLELNILDLSENSLKLSKQKVKRECNMINGDFLTKSNELIKDKKTYNIIFSCRVFQHFINVKKCLENTYKLLSEDGFFLLVLPNSINYDITIDKTEGLKKLNGGSEQIEWINKHETWNNILTEIGFKYFTYRLPDEQWGLAWILKK